MQSDILMQTLTVRETLMFAAKLKMNATEAEQKKKITQLANELKL
jgi:ABC-type multidrug transport system ATPase subunit